MFFFLRPLALCILVGLQAIQTSDIAHAKSCASTSIEARGEQSRFVWLAKTKARANWRHKVRATPNLGSSYANWARADNTEEKCLTGPLGTVCIFVGTPCLP